MWEKHRSRFIGEAAFSINHPTAQNTGVPIPRLLFDTENLQNFQVWGITDAFHVTLKLFHTCISWDKCIWMWSTQEYCLTVGGFLVYVNL